MCGTLLGFHKTLTLPHQAFSRMKGNIGFSVALSTDNVRFLILLAGKFQLFHYMTVQLKESVKLTLCSFIVK
jgi:hypothetical protein